jgi:hypothetical protein
MVFPPVLRGIDVCNKYNEVLGPALIKNLGLSCIPYGHFEGSILHLFKIMVVAARPINSVQRLKLAFIYIFTTRRGGKILMHREFPMNNVIMMRMNTRQKVTIMTTLPRICKPDLF